MSRLPKPAHHRAHALQWEAHAPKLESGPPSLQLAKAHGSNKNPAHSHKEINNLKKKLFALKKNNVYFYGTMTARIALIVHNCFLWTAPFCFTRLSQNLSVSLHLHGSHSFFFSCIVLCLYPERQSVYGCYLLMCACLVGKKDVKKRGGSASRDRTVWVLRTQELWDLGRSLNLTLHQCPRL